MEARLTRRDYYDEKSHEEVYRLVLEIPENAAMKAVSIPALENAIKRSVLTFALAGFGLDVSAALANSEEKDQ